MNISTSPRGLLLSFAAYAAFTAAPGGSLRPLLSAAEIQSTALTLSLQKRVETKEGSGDFRIVTTQENWDPRKTAIIVCDMWDLHHCKNAVKREGEFAPRMNVLLEKARAQGVFILFAPSNCMKFYEGHPARLRAQNAPRAVNPGRHQSIVQANRCRAEGQVSARRHAG